MADESAAKRPFPADAAELQSSVQPARLKLIYESADRRLCLFEDCHGHITAVRAENLT